MLRSAFSMVASNRRTRSDASVPHHYYVYGIVDGKTKSYTIHCTLKEANRFAYERAVQFNVTTSTFRVKRA